MKNFYNSVIFKDMSTDEIEKCLSALHAAEKTDKKDEMILMAGDATERFGLV